MLDDRKTAILSAVVQEYIATAQPVGSTHIADAPGVGVSSATVRNDMAVLEQEGYLAQPHTSAGRIPTDKGYRFFVDHLTMPGRLDASRTAQVGDFFSAAHGRIEELLHQTSDLLATMTNSAAMVVGPTRAAAEVRSVQVVGLSATHATVVVVFANGVVENEVIAIPDDTTDDDLSWCSAMLSEALVGHPLADVVDVPPSGSLDVDTMTASALTAMREVADDEHVWVGGAASMAASFDAVEVVRNVLQALEQQFVVVSLVRNVIDRGMSVAIGVEHGVEPLASCSVVVSPVVVDGEQLGSVGVLGPTRMNYPQALATVGIVSDRLGRHLADNA